MAKVETRLQTLSFSGKVDAGANLTLVSQRINVPFKVKEISCSFAPGVNRLMNLEFYVSPDDSAPTVKPLTGVNILAALGHVGYITGDDERKVLNVEMETISAGYYVKVFAENTDTYEHTIDAQVTIELQYKNMETKSSNPIELREEDYLKIIETHPGRRMVDELCYKGVIPIKTCKKLWALYPEMERREKEVVILKK